jgi:hypothetical protein
MRSDTTAMSISGLSVIPHSDLSGRLNKPWEPLATICPDSEQAILVPRPKFCPDREQAFVGIIRGPVDQRTLCTYSDHVSVVRWLSLVCWIADDAVET